MKTLWQPLRDALKDCRAEGMAVPFWWRDDDAVRATPALDRLSAVAQRSGLPVHLAVIPAHAEQSLGHLVRQNSHLIPLVHGWAHENHAPAGEKKAEFGHPWPGGADRIAQAHARLTSLFGDSLLSVFVPPWNRFDDIFLDALVSAGYRGFSGFLPRKKPNPAPGLVQINTHIDPVDWRGTRGLADPAMVIGGVTDRLRARSSGAEDSTEPLGLLTHHLVHQEDVWHFVESFVDEMLAGGAQPVSTDLFEEPAE